jgi:two-component system, NarL family, nitrate/nitrite response regulator NarL
MAGESLPSNSMSVIRVLTADAQPLFSDALCRVIRQCSDFQLVGQASDGRDALRLLRALRPDVALLERSLPIVDGPRILRLAAEELLPTRIVLVSAAPDPVGAYEMVERGVVGCLTRTTSAEQVREAVTTVASGRVFLASEIQDALACEIRLRAGGQRPLLSEREREVLRRVADGQNTPEIARSMYLSVGTVKTHLNHLYDKLGVAERAAAVAVALRRGLMD